MKIFPLRQSSLNTPSRAYDAVLLAISFIAIFGAGTYYLYALNWLGIIITLLLAAAAFALTRKRFYGQPEAEEGSATKISRPAWLFIGVYLATAGLAVAMLVSARSGQALVSPWQVVNASFFWFYAAASLILILLLAGEKVPRTLKTILISLHYLLSFSVACFVYKIGYGFDPFIHQAALELIDAQGVVLPKTPYYLGTYSLIIVLHKFTGLAIGWLSKMLVPILASVLLPTAIVRFLRARSEAVIVALMVLGLSFSPFIMTTPQNLSYLFLILALFAGLSGAKPLKTTILALAATAIHPLAGLPALAFAAWLWLYWYQKNISLKLFRIGRWFILAATASVLPIVWLLSGAGSLNIISGGKRLLASLASAGANFGSAGQENWLLNSAYFLANNHLAILILLAAAGIYYIYRSRQMNENRRGLLAISAALFAAYLASHFISFREVIAYEQSDFAARLLMIIFLFLSPFIISLFSAAVQKISQETPAVKIICLVFAVLMLTASLYLSYPRLDRYHNSRGYSTSESDLAAVRSIESQASAPYVVLANQQVSAAALRAFGFDHYYQTATGPIYFYPIPTGGSLYQYYLDMVYKNPSRSTALEAMDLAGVSEAYLIVNKYWNQSDRVIGAAKLVANDYWDVDGQVYIFKYRR